MSGVAVSVNLWVRFVRITGSGVRSSLPPVGRVLFLLGTDEECLFSSLWSLLDAFSRSSRVYHDLLASFVFAMGASFTRATYYFG